MLEPPAIRLDPPKTMRSPLRPSLAIGLLLALGAASCGGDSEPGGERDPNRPPQHVLLIVIDTLRADHLSCYGYPRVTSPNIDALASRGVRFEQHIAQSSWTAPSMVTMMTGQRLTQRRFELPEDKPALAELFKDAGYRTAAWSANQLLNEETGFARGFDVFVGEAEWHAMKPVGRLDEVIAWLKENKDNDTFTWVHFTDPHDPYVPPAKLRTEEPAELLEEQRALIESVASERRVDGADAELAFIADEIGRYNDEILSVDVKVRRLLMTLQEIGRFDDAVIVVTSDHGETLWQRPEPDLRIAMHLDDQQKGKRDALRVRDLFKQTHGEFVYQELVRVPLIIAAPGLEPGSVISTPLESLHLPTTILALAGVDVDGTDEMLGGNLFGADVPTGAYAMTQLGEAFVSEDGWKLILPSEFGAEHVGGQVELYDLGADPQELRNLATERPEKVAELVRRIEERRADALPQLSDSEAEQALLDRIEELKKHGYVGDGGFLDVPDDEGSEGDGASGAGEGAGGP